MSSLPAIAELLISSPMSSLPSDRTFIMQIFRQWTASLEDIEARYIIIGLTLFVISINVLWSVVRKILGQASNGAEKRSIDTKSVPHKWDRRESSSYKRPKAPPYPNFDLETTKPLPYRPFRYGPNYFINLGIRNMNMDEWIEVDNEWHKFHDAKLARIEERGERICRTAPEAHDAAIELCEELTSYLPERYPSVFQSLDRGRKGMCNLSTGEVFDVGERPLKEDPMQMAAKMIQDDIAVMIEKEGQYYLLAGAIHLAGAWRLEDKFGLSLSAIHTTGNVPQYRERLEKGMMNLFRRLRPESPVLRNNYFIQNNGNLPWNVDLGPEDEHGQATKSWGGRGGAISPEQLWFRSERQSLRRLPRSGAVIFTIRVYFHPILAIADEPYVPGRLASGIRSWGDDVAKYKGRESFSGVLLPFLDKKHEQQLVQGLDLTHEDQVRRYPW